nr:MAG TPA: tRNA ligase kinase domain [Caudoviricetes sp.]
MEGRTARSSGLFLNPEFALPATAAREAVARAGPNGQKQGVALCAMPGSGSSFFAGNTVTWRVR